MSTLKSEEGVYPAPLFTNIIVGTLKLLRQLKLLYKLDQ